MQREYHRWWSKELGRDMELLVFGHAGTKVLVFPTSMGRFFEYENNGMVATLADRIGLTERATPLHKAASSSLKSQRRLIAFDASWFSLSVQRRERSQVWPSARPYPAWRDRVRSDPPSSCRDWN